MSTQDALNFVSRQIHIYLGLAILIFGVIGGILNLIIFTTLKSFRETTCAFYLTVVSIVDISQLSIVLLIRILGGGFNIDIRKVPWICKIHIYIGGWCVLVSITGMCLAAIDQYISMTKYRHFSNLRRAQRAILITCIVWTIYSICWFLYWDASFGTCTMINSNLSTHTTRFHFSILVGFLPISLMIIFSLLAFCNARTLTSRQVNIVRLSRDRQLTAMTLIHVVFLIITTLPYIIVFIYSRNQNNRNSEQLALNNLLNTITVLIDYTSYAGTFYIYCCVSERFRKQLVYVLTKSCSNRWQQRFKQGNHNRIVPNIDITIDRHRISAKQSFLDISVDQ